jgi:hypothetical protein
MVSCAYIRMVNIKQYKYSKCEQWWMMTSMVVSENGLYISKSSKMGHL